LDVEPDVGEQGRRSRLLQVLYLGLDLGFNVDIVIFDVIASTTRVWIELVGILVSRGVGLVTKSHYTDHGDAASDLLK